MPGVGFQPKQGQQTLVRGNKGNIGNWKKVELRISTFWNVGEK